MNRQAILIGMSVCGLTAASALAFTGGIHIAMTQTALRNISTSTADGTLRFTGVSIDEIAQANKKTDAGFLTGSPPFSDSWRHFDSESFAVGSQALINQKDEIIRLLLSDEACAGQKARVTLGQALHAIQDFYTHSNWIVLHPGTINPALGVSTFGASTAAPCPLNPATYAAGLAQLTSGYWEGITGCAAIPMGKCRHGQSTVPGTGCTGTHQDDPSRPLHTQAASSARMGSEAFVQLILDDSRITASDAAKRKLMLHRGTLAFAIDDTGSMGEEIGEVVTQVTRIIASVTGTENEPAAYVFTRFGDPDVGPAIATTDAMDFLSALNALSPSGGGDCPELSQNGLLETLLASCDDTNVYLFTDASAKDAPVRYLANSYARAHRIRITTALTGTCSPIDPTYIANTQETGGQLFFLDQFEIGELFDLVQPQLSGNFVTVAQAQGSLAAHEQREIVAPVDPSLSQIVFSAAMDQKDAVTILRPNGQPVTAADPDAVLTAISGGCFATISAPASGNWTLQFRGTGQFVASVQGNSELSLQAFDLVQVGNPMHPAYWAIEGEPVVGATVTGMARMLGVANTAVFIAVDLAGNFIAALPLAMGDQLAAPNEFVGQFPVPALPFRVQVYGLDAAGIPYQRTFPPVFQARRVGVSVLTATEIPGLPAGRTTTVSFQVTNFGPQATFAITATDSRGYLSRREPPVVTLAQGTSQVVSLDLMVPPDAPLGQIVSITLTAAAGVDPSGSNSALLDLPVIAAGPLPPACCQPWDNGRADDRGGQLSQLNVDADWRPLVNVAFDDFWLCDGQVNLIDRVSGRMKTSALLPKFLVVILPDCDGKPDLLNPLGVAGLDGTRWDIDQEDVPFILGRIEFTDTGTPDADGLRPIDVVAHFDGKRLVLKGGAYWTAIVGISANLNQLDEFFWATSGNNVVKGRPGVFFDGDTCRTSDELCCGCTDYNFCVEGETCKILLDNGPPITSFGPIQFPGYSSIDNGSNSATRSRAADKLVIPPCTDFDLCYIEGWMWTNCDRIALQFFDDDCRCPDDSDTGGELRLADCVMSIGPTLNDPTGKPVTLKKAQFFFPIDDELVARIGRGRTNGFNVWLSLLALGDNRQNARGYFAIGGQCDQPCTNFGPACIRPAPFASTLWRSTTLAGTSVRGFDTAFLIAVRPEVESDDPTGQIACPADINRSGQVTVQDIFDFLAAWFAGCP